MSNKSEIAIELFRSGFNCSQSVSAVFCKDYGLSIEQCLKLSCGFGGGIRSGEVCGAVTGAVMVIGLKYGNNKSEDTSAKSLCYSKTVEFISEFKKKTGSMICKEILSYDISTESGMKQAKDKGLFTSTCVDMVKTAAELLEELGY